MGLLQKAVETYDFHRDFVGKQREGHQTLAPVSHIVTSADLEITIDDAGRFVSARAVGKDEPKIIIPATEESGGRSGKNAYMVAHPLCEKLSYLTAEENYYIPQLEAWAQSAHAHPMLQPILTYVKGRTILSDLERSGVKADEKMLVRWRVNGLGEGDGACWTDPALFEAFTSYYRSRKQADEPCLCMIEGELLPEAKQHPKGIIPMFGNAKIISANDTSGFTYRGRFTDDRQSATVSYEASQKAHNALRWIAAEQGVRVVFGGRTFLCWNPHGIRTCTATGPFHVQKKAAIKPSDYREDLRNTLLGYRAALPENEDVVIAAFDAATTGRLAVTYYNELQGSDFLQRLHDWDLTCCWWMWDNENRCYSIQSPALWQIVNCAFGTQRTEKGKKKLEADDRVMKQQMQRLVSCRVDRAKFPADIKKALVNRASTPLAYDSGVRAGVLAVTCAVLKKYYYDHDEEDWEMALEKDRRDRSYQYGRLLAVLEKVERDTYGSDEGREPNAIRMQSTFCQRPLYVANLLEKQLEKAYFPKLNVGSRAFYKKLIGEIMEKIHDFPESDWNKALGDTYLMGYYLQRNDLYKGKREDEQEEK